MQCPAYIIERELMFTKLETECPTITELIKVNPSMASAWLMGKEVDGVSMAEHNSMMEVCGYYICKMYMKCLRNRAGIG